MASDPFLVGVLFGFVPAMGFLYILLSNYQAFFDEKRIFKTFFFGMIAGLAVTILQGILGPGAALDPATAGALTWWGVGIYAALFGALTAAVGAASLNWRTFRARRDTPFYGAAMGLGFGSVNAVFVVGRSVPGLTSDVTGWAEVFLLVQLGLYFMGSILVHAGAFVWIGLGTAGRGVPQAMGRATLVVGAYTWLFFVLPRIPQALANLVPLLGLSAAIAFVAFILRHELDQIVPAEVAREAGLHLRRLARRRMREHRQSQEPKAPGPGLEDQARLDEQADDTLGVRRDP